MATTLIFLTCRNTGFFFRLQLFWALTQLVTYSQIAAGIRLHAFRPCSVHGTQKAVSEKSSQFQGKSPRFFMFFRFLRSWGRWGIDVEQGKNF